MPSNSKKKTTTSANTHNPANTHTAANSTNGMTVETHMETLSIMDEKCKKEAIIDK